MKKKPTAKSAAFTISESRMGHDILIHRTDGALVGYVCRQGVPGQAEAWWLAEQIVKLLKEREGLS